MHERDGLVASMRRARIPGTRPEGNAPEEKGTHMRKRTWTALLLAAALAIAPTAALAQEQGQLEASAAQAPAAIEAAPAAEEGSGASHGFTTDPTFTATYKAQVNQNNARSAFSAMNSFRTAHGASQLRWDSTYEKVAIQRAFEFGMTASYVSRPDGAYNNQVATSLYQDGLIKPSDMGNGVFVQAGVWVGTSIDGADSITASGFRQLLENSWKANKNTPLLNKDVKSVGISLVKPEGQSLWYWFIWMGGKNGSGMQGKALNGLASRSFTAKTSYIPNVFRDIRYGDFIYKGATSKDANQAKFIYALQHKLMSGYSDRNAFGTYDSIVRADVATVLWRAAGSPTVSAAKFRDVNYNSYYGKAVSWARAKGIITGYSQTGYRDFGPMNNVTREELATMLGRYAKSRGVQVSSNRVKASKISAWNKVSPWARTYVGWAVDKGVISGQGMANGTKSLNPQGSAWRSSMATMTATVQRDILHVK